MSQQIFLIGTYTRENYTRDALPGDQSEGIQQLHLDLDSGTMTLNLATSHDRNPSWLAEDPRHGLYWSCDELGPAEGRGSVSAFRRQAGTGQLELQGTWSVPGDHPCHLAPGADFQQLFVACYSSGSVGIFDLDDQGLPLGRA